MQQTNEEKNEVLERYDIIIVGGGLVGAGLASALQSTNLRIALVDARFPSNNDPRLLALNAGSCHFLENLNLWAELSAHAAPIQQVHVSNQGHFGAVRLSCVDVHLPALGYVIPAYHIETTLNNALEKLSNVTVYRPAKLTTLIQDNGLATLTIQTEQGKKVLEAPLAIGADGTESTVRMQLQIQTDIFDYAQSALVTRTTLQRGHQQIAYERFTGNGAIAMLPLPNNECATIWTADNETINQLLSLSDKAFVATLQKEFGYRLGRLLNTAERHVYPLRMVRAEKAVSGCVFLLGNSAHTLSPIAAQGFNLALYEVAVLVDGIRANLNLQQISEQIESQQSVSIGLSHRLTKIFSKRYSFMSLGLQLGMMGMDIATPVKKRFIAKVMGKTGHVPKLLLKAQEL